MQAVDMRDGGPKAHRMTLPPSLRLLASDQAGVFTTAQARTAGLSPLEIARLVRTGDWTRIRRGALTDLPWSALDIEHRHRLQARAVLLRLTAPSVLSHHSAAVHHGLRLHEVPLDVVHVTHPLGRGSPRREADVQHHEADLPDDDVITLEGLRVTSAPRTAHDLARSVEHASAVVALDGVLASSVARAELLALHTRHLDWPGSRAAGRALAAADGRSESAGETLLRVDLTTVGWAPEVLQLRIATDVGVVRADMAWRSLRLVAEFDGRIKYNRLLRPGERAEDVVVRERRRELAIERAGWCVVRFAWSDLGHFDELRARMAAAAARARRVAS